VDLTYDHYFCGHFLLDEIDVCSTNDMDMMLWPFFVVVLDGVDVPHHVAHVGVFYAVFVYSAFSSCITRLY
jgi:hypothetical protein